MTDSDFWKRRYQGTSWRVSRDRELAIIDRVAKETGKTVELVGLGAGSAEYIAGSAAASGFERGGADLHVVGTSVYLEITGPQTRAVTADQPLWVRPDKIASARANYPAHETWVVHWLERDGLLRVVRLDDVVFDLVDQGVFPIAHPVIHGARETYVEIPATHPLVYPWDHLIQRLRVI